MPKTYHASMSIGGYRSDNGVQDIVNITFYGPRGGLRTLETLMIGEAQMLVAAINDALANASLTSALHSGCPALKTSAAASSALIGLPSAPAETGQRIDRVMNAHRQLRDARQLRRRKLPHRDPARMD